MQDVNWWAIVVTAFFDEYFQFNSILNGEMYLYMGNLLLENVACNLAKKLTCSLIHAMRNLNFSVKNLQFYLQFIQIYNLYNDYIRLKFNLIKVK